MLAADLATWNRLQRGIWVHESIVQSADKDFSSRSFSHLSLFQPLEFGASCVNDNGCLQQGCSCQDLPIWTPCSELNRVFSKVFPKTSFYVLKERIMVLTHEIHKFCANSSNKQWREWQRDKQFCSAPIKTDIAYLYWGWDASPHLMLGAVCDIQEQPEEGCWGQKGQAAEQGSRAGMKEMRWSANFLLPKH